MTPFHLDQWLQRHAPRPGRTLPSRYGPLRYWDRGPRDAPCLVMVPDGPCFLEHFRELVALAESRYRVVVFELPGFGFSAPRGGYDHTCRAAAQAVENVFTALQLGPAQLVFSCVNGFYALRFARDNPQLVRRLWLIQTPSLQVMQGPWGRRCIPWPLRIPYLGQLICHAQRRRIPRAWFPLALPRESSLTPDYIQRSLEILDCGGCNCLASLVQGVARDREEELRGVEAPVEAVWGMRDFSHKYTDPHSILQLIPQAHLTVWDHVGHFAHLEDPARFLELLGSDQVQ